MPNERLSYSGAWVWVRTAAPLCENIGMKQQQQPETSRTNLWRCRPPIAVWRVWILACGVLKRKAWGWVSLEHPDQAKPSVPWGHPIEWGLVTVGGSGWGSPGDFAFLGNAGWVLLWGLNCYCLCFLASVRNVLMVNSFNFLSRDLHREGFRILKGGDLSWPWCSCCERRNNCTLLSATRKAWKSKGTSQGESVAPSSAYSNPEFSRQRRSLWQPEEGPWFSVSSDSITNVMIV